MRSYFHKLLILFFLYRDSFSFPRKQSFALPCHSITTTLLTTYVTQKLSIFYTHLRHLHPSLYNKFIFSIDIELIIVLTCNHPVCLIHFCNYL